MIPGIEYYRPFGSPATGTVTFNKTPMAAVGATVTINGVAYTLGTDFAGRDAYELARSLTMTVNADLHPEPALNALPKTNPIGVVYAKYYGTVVRLIATEPGTTGNLITLATSSTYITVSGAVFSGGAAATSVPFALSVPNIVALRALTTHISGWPMLVLGEVAPYDGSGGWYVFDSVSTGVDDGMTIVCPTDITHPAPGRWLKVI